MSQPLVSIIIPLYNASQYIDEAIRSALGQTWANKEIIIVDDGSSDDSLKIARKYEGDGIKVFRQQNKGASAARNKGLQEAKGQYIQFLDADDLLSADKIEKQLLALQNHADKIAVCSTVHFYGPAATNEQPSVYEESFLFDDDDPVHFLINLWGGYSNHGSMVQPNAWLTPRLLIDKAGLWNEALTLDDDGEFFCRVILTSAGILKTQGLSYYRKHDANGNLSSHNDQKSLNSLLVSTLSKKKCLAEKTNNYEASFAIYKMLFNIMLNSYLRYPDIYRAAKNQLPNIKPASYRPSVGGPFANYLSRILGWKTIKLLQLKMKPLKT